MRLPGSGLILCRTVPRLGWAPRLWFLIATTGIVVTATELAVSICGDPDNASIAGARSLLGEDEVRPLMVAEPSGEVAIVSCIV